METLPDTTSYPIFDGPWANFVSHVFTFLSGPFVVDMVQLSFALVLLRLVLATLRAQARPR